MAHVVENNNPAHHFLKYLSPFSAAAQPSKLSFIQDIFKKCWPAPPFFRQGELRALNKISSSTSIAFRVSLSQLQHRILILLSKLVPRLLRKKSSSFAVSAIRPHYARRFKSLKLVTRLLRKREYDKWFRISLPIPYRTNIVFKVLLSIPM